MGYILNMKACCRAHNSCSSSSSSQSLVVICTSYWTFGASLVPVCQGWQLCPVISPASLYRSSAGLEVSASRPAECRWWGDWKEETKRERESRVFSQFPKCPLPVKREKASEDRNRNFEASFKHIEAIFRKDNRLQNMQSTVVWGMLLHNSWSPCWRNTDFSCRWPLLSCQHSFVNL